MWCPSHLKDPKPPPDAAAKLEKARQQPGWQDAMMDWNARADALATETLAPARASHDAIAGRERALAEAQRIAAEISIAVAKRLLTSRLPTSAGCAATRALTDIWEKRAGAARPAAQG